MYLNEELFMSDYHDTRPNILFFLSDQHRADAMGCAGDTAVITPNMDKLAEESVCFEQCCTNGPLCMPARTSLITGQYINQHGQWGIQSTGANPHGQSHVRNMRDAGYETLVFGKTHYVPFIGQSGGKYDEIQNLRDWGYTYIDYVSGGCGKDIEGNTYEDFLKRNGLYDTLKEHFKANHFRNGPTPLPLEATPDVYYTNQAVDWLRSYNGTKPFYMQVNLPGPHSPYDAPRSFWDMYDYKSLPLPMVMNPPGEPVPPYVHCGSMTEEECRKERQMYYAKLTMIDECLGRVMQVLEDRGLLDNTWVIYSSDHGEMLGDHQMTGKEVFYRGSVNVPLLIRPPKGVRGWKSKGLTETVDISATVLDIAGVAPLAESSGCSLLPRIEAGDTPMGQKGKEAVFSELIRYSMIYDGRYKMIVRALTREPMELYDTLNDPNETCNLANDPTLDAVRERMINTHFRRLMTWADIEKLKEADNANIVGPGGTKGVNGKSPFDFYLPKD